LGGWGEKLPYHRDRKDHATEGMRRKSGNTKGRGLYGSGRKSKSLGIISEKALGTLKEWGLRLSFEMVASGKNHMAQFAEKKLMDGMKTQGGRKGSVSRGHTYEREAGDQRLLARRKGRGEESLSWGAGSWSNGGKKSKTGSIGKGVRLYGEEDSIRKKNAGAKKLSGGERRKFY